MKRLLATCVVLGVVSGRPVPAGAHRLDEYLQATRVSIDRDRVTLEIDLTPGVSVAPRVLAWIDTNRDGQISTAESETYARQVLSAVVLSVDGRMVPVTLVDRQFPDPRDMGLGVGVIRLRARSQVPLAASGRHELSYSNNHQSEGSVYLVNALVPDDPRIHITAQRRDRAQHALTIDYDVATRPGWTRFSWLVGGLATIAVLTLARRAGLKGQSSPGSEDPGLQARTL
jgi:hypothetical protein